VNAWYDDWPKSRLSRGPSRDKIARELQQQFHGHCPMSWVAEKWNATEDYNTARSSFWRVIRWILTELEIVHEDDPDWPSHVAFTNLYKVSPADGGNPNTSLKNAQYPACREMLHREIAFARPKRLLFMTGITWTHCFLPAMDDVHFTTDDDSPVELHGRPRFDWPCRLVVTWRPERRNAGLLMLRCAPKSSARCTKRDTSVPFRAPPYGHSERNAGTVSRMSSTAARRSIRRARVGRAFQPRGSAARRRGAGC